MKGNKKKGKDPHAKREAKKYDNPIASREFISEFLAERGSPVTYDKLAAGLPVTKEEELEGLRRRLIAMVRDGQLMKNRRGAYALVDKMSLIPGTIQAHKDGFGFLIPEAGGDDLYLSAKEMRRVIHGDRVLGRVISKDRKGRLEGGIIEVIERKTSEVVGRFCDEDGICFVIPSNKNMPQDILIPQDQRGKAEDGQMVQVKLIAQPDRRRQAVGQVIQILGEHMAPGMEIDVAVLAYNIPHTWPTAVVQEAEKYAPEVPEQDCKGRKDLRDMALLTIDGEDARDFDDAVFCEPRKEGGWHLVVAIADVSHYVQLGSALDQEAQERGTSVYFPERVIPMLPEALSNGLCSLNPHVDRLCMVCDMEISANGEIKSYQHYDAVMHSKARMTYGKVHSILHGDEALREEYKAVVPDLENLYDLFKVFRQQRQIRGALDFESTETRIVFGDDQKIEKIVPVVRNEAHMLIEECMLAANVCAARFLHSNKLPGLYRVHDTPKEERIQELHDYLSLNGMQLTGGDTPQPSDFQKLLAEIHKLPDFEAAQTMVLRSMNQAVYSPDNKGHFGLAYKEYGHFTSPIRRYPDLLLHRAIRHSLKGGDATNFDYNADAMQKLGEHCSTTERRADEATRDVVSWLKCEYMSHHVGEDYTGKVTGVMAFGLFVQLKEVYVEGLVHVTSLKGDYYRFEQAQQALIGERSGVCYKVGQELMVRVARVDIEQRKIDFMLLDDE